MMAEPVAFQVTYSMGEVECRELFARLDEAEARANLVGHQRGCIVSVWPLYREAALTPRADYGITLDPAEADGPTMPPIPDELTPDERRRSREYANRIIVESGLPPSTEGPATVLIADILASYPDELDKAACDRCEQCGKLIMCSFHSVLSMLQRHTHPAPTPSERG